MIEGNAAICAIDKHIGNRHLQYGTREAVHFVYKSQGTIVDQHQSR